MNRTGRTDYQAREFARKAGVSVRTLHHYDRLGLLKPRARTASGYRLYGAPDFARLQQIVTLKFIGFPLRQIKRLLAGAALPGALRLQRMALEEKQRQLTRAIEAIREAERVLGKGQRPAWEAFNKIVQAIQMQTNNHWSQRYYNEEARKLIDERRALWSPKLQQEIENKWTQLIQEVEEAAAKGTDPASPAAQTLGRRHSELIAEFTGGHAPIEKGLEKLWSDSANWTEDMKKQVFEPFAQRGIAAAQGTSPSLLSPAADAFLKKVLELKTDAEGGSK